MSFYVIYVLCFVLLSRGKNPTQIYMIGTILLLSISVLCLVYAWTPSELTEVGKAKLACFEASFEFLERSNEAHHQHFKYNNPSNLPLTEKDRRDQYWSWWQRNVMEKFPGQQLTRDAPTATCQHNPMLGLSNDQIVNPEGQSCVPAGFDKVMNDSVRELIQRRITESSSPSDYSALLQFLNNSEGKDITFLEAQALLTEEQFFYSDAVGDIFRNEIRGALVTKSDPERSVWPGDFFETAEPNMCKCALGMTYEPFRTCTLNPWEAVDPDTGKISEERLGFTQKCERVHQKFRCVPFIHYSVKRKFKVQHIE